MTQSRTWEAMSLELRQADATIGVLKGALAADTVEAIAIPHWALSLSPQCRAMMGVLIAKYPNYLTSEQLADRMPGRDHVNASNIGSVAFAVCKARKQLGPTAIVTLKGSGFRVGDAFMAALRVAA